VCGCERERESVCACDRVRVLRRRRRAVRVGVLTARHGTRRGRGVCREFACLMGRALRQLAHAGRGVGADTGVCASPPRAWYYWMLESAVPHPCRRWLCACYLVVGPRGEQMRARLRRCGTRGSSPCSRPLHGVCARCCCCGGARCDRRRSRCCCDCCCCCTCAVLRCERRPRDMVLVNGFAVTPDGTYRMATRSVLHPDAPVSSSHVRATVHFTGWVLRPVRACERACVRSRRVARLDNSSTGVHCMPVLPACWLGRLLTVSLAACQDCGLWGWLVCCWYARPAHIRSCIRQTGDGGRTTAATIVVCMDPGGWVPRAAAVSIATSRAACVDAVRQALRQFRFDEARMHARTHTRARARRWQACASLFPLLCALRRRRAHTPL
jgi:hypothetical protein